MRHGTLPPIAATFHPATTRTHRAPETRTLLAEHPFRSWRHVSDRVHTSRIAASLRCRTTGTVLVTVCPSEIANSAGLTPCMWQCWPCARDCPPRERRRALLRARSPMASYKGTHRRVTTRQRALATAAAVSTISLLGLPAVAHAAPQGGVTTPGTAGGDQGGVTTPGTGAGNQGGVTTPRPDPAPQPPSERQYWVAPSPQSQQAPSRPIPTYNEQSSYSPPLYQQQFRAPVPVEPVAPIEAPVDEQGKKMLRIGDRIAEQPNWMTDDVLERTNNTAAGWEADASTFWRSVGVDDNRADRVAASMVTGGLVGGAVVGTTAAVACGAAGAALGAPYGAVISQAIFPYAPIISTVPGVTVGSTAGAAAGAALCGPVGVAVGATGGALVGAAIGGGEATDEELVPTELPQLPDPDPVQIEKDVEEQATVLAADPVGAAAIQTVADVPQIIEDTNTQVRQAVADAGGQHIVDAVDQAAEAHAEAMAPVNEMLAPFNDRINTAVGAFHDGINAVVNPQ